MQIRHFGSLPKSHVDHASEDLRAALAQIMQEVTERYPFARASATELAREDRDLICRMMKWDPRDRPTVQELMQDS